MNKIVAHFARFGIGFLAATGAAFTVSSSTAAETGSFPTKPVTLIVAYPPGGPADMIGRQLAQGLTKMWGQSVVIENKPGATGLLGLAAVARASSDGYTLGVIVTPATAIAPLIQTNFQYDVTKDFTAIAALADYSLVMLAGPQTNAKSLKDLLAAGKSIPNGLSYGSSGVGGTNHLAGELLSRSAKTAMLHIPYKGNAPALNDVMAGLVSFTFAQTDAAIGLATSGKLAPLAITSTERNPSLPNIPTLVELGYKDMVIGGWTGVFGPASMSKDLVMKIEGDIAKVKATPEFRNKMESAGFVVPESSHASFTARVKNERDFWKKKIQDEKISLQ